MARVVTGANWWTGEGERRACHTARSAPPFCVRETAGCAGDGIGGGDIVGATRASDDGVGDVCGVPTAALMFLVARVLVVGVVL